MPQSLLPEGVEEDHTNDQDAQVSSGEPRELQTCVEPPLAVCSRASRSTRILAAIGVSPESSIAPGEVESGERYVAVKMTDMVAYSCYFSPNRPFPEFEDFLSKLEESLSRRRGRGKMFTVAVDFNA